MQAIFKNLGIYLHVPFCAKACSYCRFYKTTPTPLDISAYVDCLASEIDLIRQEAESSKISQPIPDFEDVVLNCAPQSLSADTFFWGGGTPSILPERQIEKLAKSLSIFGAPREWTVEVAPTGLTKSKLDLLKSIGVTRISMGVQSFSEKTLTALGRTHTVSAVRKAIDLISRAEFQNFNIDLIFCAAGQTKQEWLDDIQEASRQPVDHISAYCLEFENATSACVGRLGDADYLNREREADFFEIAMDALPERGFGQYEISNYSKPQCECLHNVSTWKMARWIGLGPSAASQWRGVRRRNEASLEKWIQNVRGANRRYCDVVDLSARMLFVDAIIFGLRTRDGVDFKELKTRFPNVDCAPFIATARELANENLLYFSGENIRLTKEGKSVADSVALEFLGDE